MKTRRPGFTLIELLVVIAILSLLVSLLLPVLKNARAAARDVLCRTHQRSMVLAQLQYANDNAEVLRPGKWNDPDSPTGSWAHYFTWKDGPGYLGRIASDSAGVFPKFFACPDGANGPKSVGQYLSGNPNFVYNYCRFWLGYIPLGAVSGDAAAGGMGWRRITQHPSRRAFYLEKADHNYMSLHSESHMRYTSWSDAQTDIKSGFLSFRHSGGNPLYAGGIPNAAQNVAYMDGSVSPVKAQAFVDAYQKYKHGADASADLWIDHLAR